MADCGPGWRSASLRRVVWARSRDSWQAPVSAGQQDPAPLGDTTSSPAAPETGPGPIPTKIAKWLSDCRTPLGASLDEQSSSPSKGPRNGCSFEDDLSLGAEANHLQSSGAKPDSPSSSIPAREKRNQFRQKGRSMNSTGSGKSSGTVSSVSELLDLYEEDPEEILYNLGFGSEEPDIASKIPSRFFNNSSSAKGIDIKVYLGAQMQRMELENPNFALTSRFRQTEVLATVANVFSEIYSQVSGHPLQRIASREAELKKNTSALNAVKILKRNLTRPSLLATEGAQTPSIAPCDSDQVEDSTQGPPTDPETKPQTKVFRNKDSVCLATVEEETTQNGAGGREQEAPLLSNGEKLFPNASERNPALSNGIQLFLSTLEEPVHVSTDGPAVVPVTVVDSGRSAAEPLPRPGSSTRSLLPIQLSQTRDSFEMEELQSTEDEVTGSGSLSQTGREHLLRTTSQQSDSSGFAEEPSTDVSASYLKVQESTDSCDSETTVTSHVGGLPSPLALDHPAYERLQGEDPLLQPSSGSLGLVRLHEEAPQHVDQVVPASVTEEGSSADPAASSDERGSVTETNPSSPSSCSTAQGPVAECDSNLGRGVSPEPGSDPGAGFETGGASTLSSSERLRGALIRAEQRASSVCEERAGRVWVRTRDLLRDSEGRERYPLHRSSSLPTSLLSPTRVVSSVHVRVGQGVVRRYPTTYRYRYEEEEEPVAKGNDDEAQTKCRSTLFINPSPVDGKAETQTDGAGAPPYPLNVPQHLTRSSSSLYSAPADCFGRHQADGHLWSASSVPDLSQQTLGPHPLPPRPASSNYSSINHGPVNAPHYSHIPGINNNPPYTHTPSAPYTHYIQPQIPLNVPHSMLSSQPHLPYTPAPYSGLGPPPSVPHCTPYGFNMQGRPYHPQVPAAPSHTAPYSQPYRGAPYYQTMTCGHQYNGLFSGPFASPSSLLSCDSPTPPPAMGSTEMQLRRVLHDIRDTMQRLCQSPTMQRDGACSGMQSPQLSTTPLYEELQMRRQSLNVFRTQMMDLELTLMRQQAMVYQHLGPEERREAEQLQRLRAAVRQELQELELQLEDRLLALEDQLRSAQHSRLCRHPLLLEIKALFTKINKDHLKQETGGHMSRGHSIDSLTSSSALRALEPVCDLLREQLSLQSELGYDASLSAVGTPVSGRSSRAASPTRGTQPPPCSSPSPQRGSLFRSSVSLTPIIPPRPGAETHQPASLDRPGVATSPGPGEERPRQEQGGAGVEGGGNAHLQQLVAEIKQNLAEEIRQEIVKELLAAVSPRRSPVAAREPPA